VFSIAVLTGLFILFRQMERWLHQHIFKVGWLLTRNSRVTTVLYYTLFIPGILLHELVSWLVAGMLNVHATRSIAWPQSQEVGELRLNFVRISPNAPRWKRFVITLSPLVVGMLITWHIAENVYQLDAVFAMMSSGALTDISAAFGRLLATPDFWLWFYLLFTISNTMFASLERSISTLRSFSSNVLVIATAVILVGATSATFSYVSAPFENALSVLSELLLVLIAVNFVATIFLGTIESIIEKFSDQNITFRGGRMEAVPRQQPSREQRGGMRARPQQRTAGSARQPKPTNPITSVYKLAFPVPGAPTPSVSNPPKPETKAQPSPADEKISPIKLSQKSVPGSRSTLRSPADPATPSASPLLSVSELLKPPPVAQTADVAASTEESAPTPSTTSSENTADAAPVPEQPAADASSSVSPFAEITDGSFAANNESTADTASHAPQPAVPARLAFSSFAKPLISPSADSDETASGSDLPDPFAGEALPAKPAVPRNPIYNRANISPFGAPKPAPKAFKVESDRDAEEILDRLMKSAGKDLSYEPDEEYYSEEGDEYTSRMD
jgi:hypothetical protein